MAEDFIHCDRTVEKIFFFGKEVCFVLFFPKSTLSKISLGYTCFKYIALL